MDIDTIENSGRITLPEDTMTRVMSKCAWEYCIYVKDNEYGICRQDGTKLAMPFGMLVQRTTGDSGNVKVKVAKSLVNTPQAIRYTISTFDPDIISNSDSLWQGGSTAADVFPGSPASFGGEINGYGQITASGLEAVNNYTIYYIYDGINPIVEYSPNGSILSRYIYAGGLHVAKIAGADTNWYHCDALGSPRKMTNESGAVVWSATYYPFGEMTTESGNTHGFTGKEYDSEMGLNYFCQRYYDPEIGRFITLDPFRGYIALPQTQNLYTYCVNNPLKYIDPLGLDMQPYMPDPDEDYDEYDEWWWPIGTIFPVGGITVWGNPDPWYSDEPYDVFYGEDPTGNYGHGLHSARRGYMRWRRQRRQRLDEIERLYEKYLEDMKAQWDAYRKYLELPPDSRMLHDFFRSEIESFTSSVAVTPGLLYLLPGYWKLGAIPLAIFAGYLAGNVYIEIWGFRTEPPAPRPPIGLIYPSVFGGPYE